MIYLDRLNYYLEILAKKRTPEEEAKDIADTKKRLQEKEEEKAKKREEEGRKPLEYKKEAKEKKAPETSEQQKAPEAPQPEAEQDVKDIITKLKRIDTPRLILINTNIYILHTETSDEVKKKAESLYQDFLKEPDIKDKLDDSINLTNKDGIHSWICDNSNLMPLSDAAFAVGSEGGGGLVHIRAEISKDFLKEENPFKGIVIDTSNNGLGEQINPKKVISTLADAWEPIFKALNPEGVKEEEEEKEDVEEDTDVDDTDEKEDEEEKENTDINTPKIKPGDYHSLKEPWIFMLDPRKRTSEYQNFLDKEDPKGSKILPKALHFLNSDRLKSVEGFPVQFYFLNKNDAIELQKELNKEAHPLHELGPFDKKLFDNDDPFTNLKIKDKAVDPILIKELNKVWMDANAQTSGNPMPAVQANFRMPLDFFRLLNKKQRFIELYVGGHPESAGTKGTIYVLTGNEKEANNFVTLLRKLKMPSLFYDRLSANSDIDTDFKNREPRKLTPSNALILEGEFKPEDDVMVNEFNQDLAVAINPKLKEIIDQLLALKKHAEVTEKKMRDIAPSKKEDAIKKLQSELKITQLELLHAFARVRLGNRTQHPGTFIRNKGMIGTHIAQFNATMTKCFLWGSITKHVTIDPKETIKQLPFVTKVITTYL